MWPRAVSLTLLRINLCFPAPCGHVLRCPLQSQVERFLDRLVARDHSAVEIRHAAVGVPRLMERRVLWDVERATLKWLTIMRESRFANPTIDLSMFTQVRDTLHFKLKYRHDLFIVFLASLAFVFPHPHHSMKLG